MTGQDPKNLIALLLLKYKSALFALAVALVRDFQTAEDVFQEGCVEIMNGAERFDFNAEFLPWARAIVTNMARRHWQRNQRSPLSLSTETLELVAAAMAEPASFENWEREKIALRKCMRRLSERHRTLLLKRYGENLKGEELAHSTGVHPTSVRTTLLRLREKLHSCIQKQFVTEIGR